VPAFYHSALVLVQDWQLATAQRSLALAAAQRTVGEAATKRVRTLRRRRHSGLTLAATTGCGSLSRVLLAAAALYLTAGARCAFPLLALALQRFSQRAASPAHTHYGAPRGMI